MTSVRQAATSAPVFPTPEAKKGSAAPTSAGREPPSPLPLWASAASRLAASGNQAQQRFMRSAQSSPAQLMRLHSVVGNHGVVRRLQAKLMVNVPGDPYEQEADRVAEQVMRMPEPNGAAVKLSPGSAGVQRKCACGGTCAACSKDPQDEKHLPIQMMPIGPGAAGGAEAPPIVHEVLNSPGQPLDVPTRTFMEGRFGRDFGQVRVHTDTKAAECASGIFARAFTGGSHVVFAAGQYRPNTNEGRFLLAHELSHVVQQNHPMTTIRRSPDLRWVHDVKAARYRGQVMAARIRAHGKLSQEARAKINSELQYFEGEAKDAYLAEVKPALAGVVEIEMPVSAEPDQPRPAAPPPEPKPPAKTCTRLPEAGPGKKCRFFVYDSTASGFMGMVWKRGAIAKSRVTFDGYAIPSGENMEETLFNILSVYPEKGCDCTDEIQFWSHGSSGNGAWISDSRGGTSELESGSFNIPGLDRFGDDPRQPGYEEWEAKLSTFQRRLVLLRRTICDSDSTIYYRSCQAFRGEQGKEFAKASSDFWRCNVAGHTKLIGLTQPGKHVLGRCEEPDWPETEGAEEEGKKGKQEMRHVKPK